MKFVVNSGCTGCGVCESLAPDVFEINGDGIAVAIDGDVAADLEADAQEAMESCPAEAIEIA